MPFLLPLPSCLVRMIIDITTSSPPLTRAPTPTSHLGVIHMRCNAILRYSDPISKHPFDPSLGLSTRPPHRRSGAGTRVFGLRARGSGFRTGCVFALDVVDVDVGVCEGAPPAGFGKGVSNKHISFVHDLLLLPVLVDPLPHRPLP